MSRKTWALISAILGIVIACLFWTEAVWWFWSSMEYHTVAIAVGGSISLSWSLVYFFSK